MVAIPRGPGQSFVVLVDGMKLWAMLERRVLDKPLTASYFLGVLCQFGRRGLYSRRL